jgi:CheY-like chemotaxis protein/nitrogen-specific signal transduction histidine kinase
MEVEWVASMDPSTGMLYATGNDVSIKEKLAEAIWQTQVEAEKARAKDVFMANMSHEIRTPLNAIIGFTDLLSQTTLSDVQTKHVDVISTASRNLSVIINDILDLAKIDGGKLELERKPVNLEETVKQVVNMHTERARSKGLKLLFTMDQGLPTLIEADQTRLSQILINLVANALKFTEKGHVRVDVLELQRDSTSVGIRFVVTDTGIGIDPAKLNMIFDRFTQAESYTTRIYGGTGLGLNIVQSLVELHGGELSVESTPGKGSSFSFEMVFPLCGEGALAQPVMSTPSKTGNALQGLHIMLVEDNEHNQILARTYLERNGALVDIVGNGMLAIQHLHSANPDLILMDIQMPVMDGIQTTEVMRKDIGVKVPIVACSAHALASEKQRCFSVGMNDYLTKPYNERGLVDIILQNVKSKGSSAGSVEPSWFDELKEDIGAEAAEKMRMSLQRSLDRWHGLLTKDLEGRDVAQLLFTSHNMAGSLGAVRLAEARQLAKECELACDSGDAGKALKLGAELLRWVEGMKQRM